MGHIDRPPITAALLCIAVGASSAAAQTVYPPVLIINPNGLNRSATIATGPAGEVVVASSELSASLGYIRYAISLDNGASFPDYGMLSGADGAKEPSLVFGDGRFWLAAATAPPLEGSWISLADKHAGETSFRSAQTIVQFPDAGPNLSQPRAAAGPDPLSGTGRVYVVHNNGFPDQTTGCSGDLRLMSMLRWQGESLGGWTTGLRISPPGNACEYIGYAPAAGVTDTGRVLTLSADRAPGFKGAESWRNGGRPWVVYSDTAGATWDPLTGPVLLGVNAAPAIAGPQVGDAVRIDAGNHLPNISVKSRPGVDDHVYAIFIGRSPEPGSTNTDLYISRSTDGGATFPSAPVAGNPNPELVHLSDYDLHMIDPPPGATDGPDQIMASVAAGACDNDVHFFWYDTVADDPATPDDTEVRLYYGRIRGYGTAGQTLTVLPLGEPFSTKDGAFVRSFGVRQGMAVRAVGRDLWVYCAYVAVSELGGQLLYAQRIKWTRDLCIADTNGNGLVGGEDLTLFNAAHGAQDPSADLNADGSVDGTDYTIFNTAYTEGCGQ